MRQDLLEFVKAAIRNPMEVASVFPTSRALAERMLNLVDLERPGKVAEVGVGTGAITKYIAPRLKDSKRYIGVELNSDMVHYMRQTFPELHFEEAPAESLAQLTGGERVTTVVSSLPWTVFSPELQKRTLTGIHDALAENGRFVTYVCLNAAWYPQAQHFGGLLNGMFRSVTKSPIEWKNVPPAFVYLCTK
ncbi:MAG: methyltransferase domain-containing protein [Bdellovibrionaceae bacterium]|nr:methyltransferase domain-containing protein [Pseudobdellovibrionaceae bacterium]